MEFMEFIKKITYFYNMLQLRSSKPEWQKLEIKAYFLTYFLPQDSLFIWESIYAKNVIFFAKNNNGKKNKRIAPLQSSGAAIGLPKEISF